MAKKKQPKPGKAKPKKSTAPWKKLGFAVMFAGFVVQLMTQPPDAAVLRVALAQDWLQVGVFAAAYAQYVIAALFMIVSRGIIGLGGIVGVLVGDVIAHQFAFTTPGTASTRLESLMVPLFNLIVMMPLGRWSARVIDTILEVRILRPKPPQPAPHAPGSTPDEPTSESAAAGT